MSNSNDTLSLKILEAYTRDVGRGAARLDYDSMGSLRASTGDVMEIRGKRRTVAKCLPLYPSMQIRIFFDMITECGCLLKYMPVSDSERRIKYLKLSHLIQKNMLAITVFSSKLSQINLWKG